MPMKPKPACPVCRRVGCTDKTHKPKPFANSKPTRERRPGWDRTRKRRQQVVAAWRAQYADWCPVCGRTGVKLSADHIVPVALGGEEDGELAVACVDCQHKQAARVGNEVQRRKRAGR